MSVIPLSDALDSWDCKIPGCRGEAHTRHGRYAMLCDQHKAEKSRGVLEDEPLGGKRARHQPDQSKWKSGKAGGFEEQARTLVAAGRELDRAIARHQETQDALRPAIVVWEAAKRELVQKRVGAE